jgi:hypothetical protein
MRGVVEQGFVVCGLDGWKGYNGGIFEGLLVLLDVFKKGFWSYN